MTDQLAMEIRNVDVEQRTITGVVAPYDSTSYLVPDPAGERIMRGAFGKSIRQRETRIPLCLNHDHSGAVGMSTSWVDGDDGLTATFRVREGERYDTVLTDVRGGFLPGMSVGFVPLVRTRGADGVVEIREGKLMEVSLVLIAAYDGAQVLAVRAAERIHELLKPFENPPAVNLSPVPNWW
jgi:HK97 family phage prohead protease